MKLLDWLPAQGQVWLCGSELWIPTGAGDTGGEPLCLPRARLPLETSAQGIQEMLSWQQQQQQHNSRDPPSSSMVTEHFVKYPELTSTWRAPVTLTGLPSTRTLLCQKNVLFPVVPAPPCPSQALPSPSAAGEGVSAPCFTASFSHWLSAAGCHFSEAVPEEWIPNASTFCLQWKLVLHWGCRTRLSVSKGLFFCLKILYLLYKELLLKV